MVNLINIKNSNEVYKFFQTPKNYRKEIKNIKLILFIILIKKL